MKPRVFVGSSVESLNVAYAIQENLDYDARVRVWPQGVIGLSNSALDDLVKEALKADFAVFVFAPDDIVKLRAKDVSVARDNVVFELGIFVGTLGKERAFIIIPRNAADLHLPSDLIGVTPGTYEPSDSLEDLPAALGAVCNQIRRSITLLGVHQNHRPKTTHKYLLDLHVDYGINLDAISTRFDNPKKVTRGQRLILRYKINNPLPREIKAWLGANLSDNRGKYLFSVTEDTEVTLAPGLQHVERPLTLALDWASGSYCFQAEVWFGKISEPKLSVPLASLWEHAQAVELQ